MEAAEAGKLEPVLKLELLALLKAVVLTIQAWS